MSSTRWATFGLIALITLLACSAARAAVLVELKVVEVPAAATSNQPTSRPASALPAAPKDARLLLSTQTLARPREPFLTCTTVGEQVIQLKGELHGRSDTGRYLVSLDYSYRSSTSNEQITSSIMLKPGEPVTIGGLLNPGQASRLIVLTLSDQPAEPKAAGR